MDRKVYLYINELMKLIDGAYCNPITCEVDPSNRCQLNCSFCMYKKYRSDQNIDLDFNIYSNLLNNLVREKIKSVTFTGGGEPLLHLRIREMISLAYNSGLDIGLVTNGVALNKLNKELISMLKFVRISVDAANKETYKIIKGRDLFDIVISNIKNIKSMNLPHIAIGISYVVCRDNEAGIEEAKKLVDNLGISYIQFKPAWIDQTTYEFAGENEDHIYVSKRYKTEDELPCVFAGLIGIVGANGKVYYCCQYRGNKNYELGDLRDEEFSEIWKRRSSIKPDIAKCPQCRYMNYIKTFKEIPQLILDHRNFL